MPDSKGNFKGISVPEIPWLKGAPKVTTEPRGMERAGERFPAELPDGTLVEAVVGQPPSDTEARDA